MVHRVSPVNRHQFLARLHQLTSPRTYLEIGIESGYSMALTRVPSIGIDPEFNIVAEIQADVHLARTTSDEFFARKAPLAHLPVPVLDLAFIDGMHLAEYVLRDYLAVERFTTPASVVVFDDMLPRSVEEAARRRTTKYWTGDVFKALDALREQRPDLLVIEVATTGTGTAVVLFPDAAQGGVLPGYDEWVRLGDQRGPAGGAGHAARPQPGRRPRVAAVVRRLEEVARAAARAGQHRRGRPDRGPRGLR